MPFDTDEFSRECPAMPWARRRSWMASPGLIPNTSRSAPRWRSRPRASLARDSIAPRNGPSGIGIPRTSSTTSNASGSPSQRGKLRAARFGGFLYVIAGPILLFLATSLLLADPVDAGPSDARAHYFRVARRFFSILALLMVWMVGVDFVLGAGFTAAGVWNAVLVVLFLVLANSNALRLHVTTTGVTWVLLLSLLISRTLNVA